MNSDDLIAGFNPIQTIVPLIKANVVFFNVPPGVDACRLLWAICSVESSFGANSVARYEFAYGPGGIYFNSEGKEAYAKYGALSCCSYGPWQILYIRALELGYRGHPLSLWDGAISLPYVVKHLSRARGYGADTLELLAAAYNGGYGAIKRQSDPVKSYIAKVKNFYDTCKETFL